MSGTSTQGAAPSTGQSLARFMTLGAVATLGNVVASIVRNKALALTVGPEGVGIIGEATQLASSAVILGALAGGPALGGAVAKAAKSGSPLSVRTAISTSLALGTVLELAGAVLAVAFAPIVFGGGWSVSTRGTVAIAAASALVGFLATTLSTAMASLEDTFGTVFAALASSALGAIVSVWLSVTFRLEGAIWSLLLSAIVTLAATSAFAWRRAEGRTLLFPILRYDAAFARACASIGAAGLVGSIALGAASVAIRAALERVGGPGEGSVLNGQLQVAIGLEAQFYTFAMAGLLTYYWPQFGAARSAADTAALLDRATAFILKTFPPMILAGVLVRRELISLLFSDRFRVASDVAVWYFAAAIPRAMLTAYQMPLYFIAKPARYAALGVVGYGTLGVVSVGLTLVFGIRGVGMGQLIGITLHLLMAVALMKRSVEANLRAYRAGIGFAFGLFVLLADALTAGHDMVRWSLAAASVGWAAINVARRVRHKLWPARTTEDRVP